jgi:magnesium transporter
MLQNFKRENAHLAPASEQDAAVATLPIWIDLINPSLEEYRHVETLLGISLPTREEMQEIEISARLYQEDGAEFLTITAVSRMESAEPALTPITFILKGNTLVTIRHSDSRVFSNFASRAQRPNAVPSSTGEQIMLSLIESLSDRMADTLERAGLEIDAISRRVFRRRDASAAVATEDLQAAMEDIGTNGDLLTKVRESLVSINRLLTYHTSTDQTDKKANKDARARVKILYRDVVALSDQATFLSSKINFLLDATLGLINLQQNQIIKIFSVAAVVFLPPTLVASIYGMNFAYQPELKWELGYPLALLMMIVSAILPYLYFKRRGWL